jgi:hypothetical protein
MRNCALFYEAKWGAVPVFSYYLTPHGIEEKARITYRFLIRTMKEYE